MLRSAIEPGNHDDFAWDGEARKAEIKYSEKMHVYKISSEVHGCDGEDADQDLGG